MSFIQWIEDTFLGLFRLLLILAAFSALIGSIVFAFMALGDFSSEVQKALPVTVVKSDDVIADVVSSEQRAKGEDNAALQKSSNLGEKSISEGNLAHVDRAVDAMTRFFERYGSSSTKPNRDRLRQVLIEKALPYARDSETLESFVAGLAETMERGLTSPMIIKRLERTMSSNSSNANTGDLASLAKGEHVDQALKESLVQIANELLEGYCEQFAAIEAEKSTTKSKAAQEAESRAKSITSKLLYAGGAFGAFLLFVVVMVVIRIERNLRALDLYPSTTVL